MRVEFGFTPRWYRAALGIDFSERWHLEPLYRHETLVAMKRELNRRFPSLRLVGVRPEETPGTLDGVHGALIMARSFGVSAEYYADNWPATRHEPLSRERVASLEPPDLVNVPVFAQVLDQIETMRKAFGRVEGYLNWQGVLNNAYRLRGPEIFGDMMEDPGLARHLFEVVSRTMIAGMRIVYGLQREMGFDVRHATVSNCLVNMVSPETYREFLLPYDLMIREAFEGFGVHNCAWNVDPYIEDYSTIPRLGYVDMGLDSDLAEVKRLCPGARRAVMYTPMDLANKTLEQLREDLARIRRDLSPCDIVMADIDCETPDERVLDFARLAEEEVRIAEEEQPRMTRITRP